MSLFIAMLLAAGDPVDDKRIVFSNCMIDFIGESLDAKMAPRDFSKAAQTACPEKRKSYADALTKLEITYGSTQSEAREYANEETQGIVDGYTGAYADYADSGTRPVKAN